MTAGAQHSFPVVVAQLLADPLAAARQAVSAGTPAIGYTGAEGPVELIVASGALPVRLRGAGEARTPRADEFLESAFVPEMRAMAEQWLSGALDFLRAVIFPRSNDSAQRLYYYLCELQRRGVCGGPRPLLMDVASLPRESSFEHTLASLRRLAEELGCSDTALALAPAVERVARREALLGRLADLRAAGSPLPGSTAYRVLRAAEYDQREAFDRELSGWLDHAPRMERAKRLLLAGSAPRDERLHVAVEAADATIVRELVDTERAPAEGATLEAVARRQHGARSPAQRMLESPGWLVEQARALRADGVVLWAIEEDEALPWEIGSQTRALQEAGMPVLALARQPWFAGPQTLSALGEFARGLEIAQLESMGVFR